MLQKSKTNIVKGNEDYLIEISNAIDLISQAIPEQLYGIKNTSSQIIYYSKQFANFLGVNPEEVIGKKTFEPFYDNPDIESTILDEDNIVISKQKPLRILKINKVKNGLKPYICTKSPIINPSTNQVAGILLQGLEISILNLNQLIINSYDKLPKNEPINAVIPLLTKRERLVIFLFIAQLTSQEIADMINRLENKNITKSTIDSLFNDQLYPKFKVMNRTALYEKLHKLNFEKFIPVEILNSTSIQLSTIQLL